MKFPLLFPSSIGVRLGGKVRWIWEMKANESIMGVVNKKELLERVLDRDERKEKA